MDRDLSGDLRLIIDTLDKACDENKEFRDALYSVCENVIRVLDEKKCWDSAVEDDPGHGEETETAELPPNIAELRPEHFHSQFTQETAPPAQEDPLKGIPRIGPSELRNIQQRCMVKAKASRWAAERQDLMSREYDFEVQIKPRDQEIIGEASQLPDCFLWMSGRNAPSPGDPKLYCQLADCYEAMAETVRVAQELGEADSDYRELHEQAVDLAAEAQAMVRAAAGLVGGKEDADQVAVHHWLRQVSHELRIYIPKYMRATDYADPAGVDELRARLTALEDGVRQRKDRAKEIKNLFNRIRYHVKKLDQGASVEEEAQHWKKVTESVERLLNHNVPPSNPELRHALLPLADTAGGDDMPQGFRRVMHEIDRYLARNPTAHSAPAYKEQSPEVGEAAAYLRNKTVVLIGGEKRPDAKKSLEEAFGLSELVWVNTTGHQSVNLLEPHVTRPEVAVVMLAIRWSSHSMGDVKQFCDAHGKPFVRLPGGYSPNQVAAQILQQVSNNLSAGNGD